MTSQKVTVHQCRTEKAAAFTDVRYRWETVSFHHKRVKHLDSCWFRKLWGEARVSKSLLQKPASQQELEPLQHVFRAVKSTCQTVRKKKIIIFFKKSDSFKAAEGKRRKQFPCWHLQSAVSSRISSREHQNRTVSCLAHIQNPFILGETERIWLFLQLPESMKLCSTNPRLTLISSSFWMGSNASEEKEAQFLLSPCGYIAISLAWPELFRVTFLKHGARSFIFQPHTESFWSSRGK